MGIFSFEDFFHRVICQDAKKLACYFTDDAVIFWHNTNEQFSAGEYIRANCEYPGKWNGAIERIENTDALIIAVTKVWNEKAAFRAASFIQLKDNKIRRLDEYWGDIGSAPEWRIKMNIGKNID